MGTLYIVPTPVGNMEDMTLRAIRVLKEADFVLAEDTRTSGILFKHFDIKNHLMAHHKFNEHGTSAGIVERLKAGQTIALVSDAGTPGISDPGFYLAREAAKAGITVQTLPGATAFVPALVSSGLPCDRFCFEGFLPAKSKARVDKLKNVAKEDRTLIFYESTHRILDSLADMQSVFGSERYVVLAREITKTWETIHGDKLADLIAWLAQDPNRTKGEMVVIVEGEPKEDEAEAISSQAMHALTLISQELPLKKAAAIVAELYGYKKNQLYQFGLELLR